MKVPLGQVLVVFKLVPPTISPQVVSSAFLKVDAVSPVGFAMPKPSAA